MVRQAHHDRTLLSSLFLLILVNMIQQILPAYQKIYAQHFQYAQELSAADLTKADKEGLFNKAAWNKSGKNAFQGLPISKKFGGKNFSALETCCAFEALGKGSKDNGLNFSIGAHLLASVLPVYIHGNKKQQIEFLPSLVNGNKIAANAITEKNSGSDVFSMDGFAEKKGKDYIINCNKLYITNAPVADLFLVYVMTDKKKGFFGGVSAFLVPANAKGISVSKPKDKMGLRTTQMGFVNFTNVKVNASQLLGEEGAGASIFNESMVWERTVLSAMLIGQLERVFDKAVLFCKQKTISGKKLITLTNIAHTLAEVQTIIHAGKNLVYDAALSIDKNTRDRVAKSAMAKSFVSENGVESIKKLQPLYGGAGYLTETEIEREYRDMFASLIYSGTTAIQKNIIAGNL